LNRQVDMAGTRCDRRILRADAADTAIRDRDLRMLDHTAGDHIQHAIGRDHNRTGLSGGQGSQQQYPAEPTAHSVH